MLSAIVHLLRASPLTEQERLAVLKGRLAYTRSGGCPYTDPHLIRAWEWGWKAELDDTDAADPDWEQGQPENSTSS